MGLHTHIETHRTPQPPGVEVLDLRHFSSQHLRPLLEHETRMWYQLMSWDYRSSADMILRYIDSKILPGYAWVAMPFLSMKAVRAWWGTSMPTRVSSFLKARTQ